jgi:hypothetical protein
MENLAPAGLSGQELNLEPEKTKFNKNSTKSQQRLPLGKNRLMVLQCMRW